MINKKCFLTALLLLALPVLGLLGGVNLKNGNFYISYTDIEMGDQYIYEDIVRTYNSKSTFSGLFGYGWGSKLDTYIKFYPDGTITLKENGGGRTTRFSTSFYDESLRELMIDELVDAAIAEGKVDNNPSAILNFRDRLIQNEELRNSYWDRYRKDGLVEYVDTYPEGTVWETFEWGNMSITKTSEGYALTSGSKDRDELFNEDGKMIRKVDGTKSVELTYDERGYLQKLINQDGSEVLFKLNSDGQIIEIRFKDGEATFEYEGENLVYSVDAGGNPYGFEYDEKHNLIAVNYRDGSRKIIDYHPSTYYAKRIVERDGETTEYEYKAFYNEDGTENKDRYGTYVIKDYYGDEVRNYYEWWIKTDDRGNRYTYRIVQDVNGIVKATYYDEICNKPTRIVQGQDSTMFAYNNRCLLTERTPSYGTPVKMKYHSDFDKIVWVENDTGITEFDYNPSGDLTFAKSDQHGTVELEYNDQGKITTMRSDSLTMLFTYNEIDKPIRIEVENLGALQVEYDEYGEITRVDSEDGSGVAMKVTQAFQQLLAIVKPSGVSLGL